MRRRPFAEPFWVLALLAIYLSIIPLMNAVSQSPGDVDANGRINRGDMFLVKDHILDRNALQGDPLVWADANLDTKIDVADMRTIDLNTSLSIPMIMVPSGTFIMGARDDGDDGTYANTDEYPRHYVTLSSYEIGKYEVTNSQYIEILNWAKNKGYLENSNGTPFTGGGSVYKNGELLLGWTSPYSQIYYSDGLFGCIFRDAYPMDNHPVVGISWYGAVAFCNWLGEMESLEPAYNLSTWMLVDTDPATGGVQFTNGYRLPSEAEWEMAAGWTGDTHWIYGFTSDTLTGKHRCNYDTSIGTMPDSAVNPLGLSEYPFTSPPGWFDGKNINPKGGIQTVNSISPVGCYDMSGNVREWCHDLYGYDYYNGGVMTNPTGPTGGPGRVARGGCWGSGAKHCRVAARNYQPANTIFFNYGFRIARSP